jgi:hypothetical protein
MKWNNTVRFLIVDLVQKICSNFFSLDPCIGIAQHKFIAATPKSWLSLSFYLTSPS